MSWYTYILLCDGETYYVGITGNLDNRIKSHKFGHNIGTKRFSDVKLVYYETYNTRKNAENRERQIKRWKRTKKKALIDGNMDLLKKLSKS